MKGIFVTGTATDVGKTYASALLIKAIKDTHRSCGYYKAALSGADNVNGKWLAGDGLYVQSFANLKDEECIVSHIYQNAVSPHLALQWEQGSFSLDKVKQDLFALEHQCDVVIVEGSGGIVCPLDMGQEKPIMLSDVMKLTSYPLVVVADAGLGTINASVLTIAYAKALQLTVKGILLNRFDKQDRMHIDNKKMIERLTGIPVIGIIENNGHLGMFHVDTLLEF